MADGSVKIEVILDDSKVGGGVKKVEGRLDGIGGAAKRGLASVGKLAGALGLVGLAYKGVDMVKNSLDGAIDRYDTLNNFPRVMQQLGFDADESQGAIDKLSDGIQGLPTRLDQVASTAQNIAVMTGDLDGAVDTTLALNNAFLASGASTADAERGLQQYVQMLAKGEVDLTSWRTLQETMPYALRETAEAFGFTGKSATNDFYEALKDGDISMSEFNAKLIELDQAQGGFAETAQEASGGIRTAWTNMGTWVVMGVASILESIDKAMGGVGSIEGAINNLKPIFSAVFGFIADTVVPMTATAIKVLIETFKEIVAKAKEVWEALQPWLPLFASIAAGVGSFLLLADAGAKGAAIMTGLSKVIGVLKGVVTLLTGTFTKLFAVMMANPIALLIAVIVAAAVLIYVYWEPISEFFVWLWGVIKDAGIAVWDWLKGVWQSTVEFFKTLWSGISDFFAGIWTDASESATSIWDSIVTVWESVTDFFISIWTSIKEFFIELWGVIVEIATNVWDGVVNVWDTVSSYAVEVFSPLVEFFANLWETVLSTATTIWDSFVSMLTTVWENIQTIAAAAWEIIKNAILGPILLLINLVTGDMEEFKSNLSAIWENISEAASAIWESIKGIVSTLVGTAIENALTLWELFKETLFGYWNAIFETASNIWSLIVDIIFDKFAEIETNVTTVMDAILQKIADAWNFIYGLWETALGLVMDSTSDNFRSILDNIHMIMEDIWIVIENVWNYIKGTFLNVLAFIKALVTGDFAVMKDIVGEQMSLIKNTVSNIWAAIRNTFLSVLAILKALVSEAWNKIKSTTSSVFNSVMNIIKAIWNNIKNFFTVTLVSIWDTVKQKFTDIVNSVKEKMEDVKDAVKQKFTDVVNSVKEKMEDVKERIETGWNDALEFLKNIDLKQIGKDVIQGFANGIKSGVKAVASAAKEAADAVTGKIKSILKIKSPSRVMIGLGGFVSEGLAIGIDDEAKRAIKSTEQLAKGVEDAFDSRLGFEVDSLSELDSIKGINANSVIGSITPSSYSVQQEIIHRQAKLDGEGPEKQPAIINVHVGNKKIATEIVDDITNLQNRTNNRKRKGPRGVSFA